MELAQQRNAEYRPLWQLLLLGAAICVVGVIGAFPVRVSAARVALVALAVVTVCIVFRWLDLGRIISPCLEGITDFEQNPTRLNRVTWFLVGFLGVLTALLLLEKFRPFYFAQDDNLDSILPVMVPGCASAFKGIFPEWNPYQFMGSPAASLGYYAFTYPLTYVSYYLSTKILGNAYALIDVLAILHILLGYVGFYWVLRRERCRSAIAMLGASCYALSGYALIFSRSFVPFSSVVAWMPFLIVCVQALVRGRTDWKWGVGFGLCIGLFFHAGHIQMWAYAILLTDLAIILFLVTGVIKAQALLPCAAAHLIGFAIAAPLLVPELLAAHNAVRYRDSTGILDGMEGLFLPDSLGPFPHPIGWGKGFPIGEMYYSGTLFMLVAAALLLSLLATRWAKPVVQANIWFFCALAAFLLALGNRGLLWTALIQIPGFNRFRFPFKFLIFLNLFATLAAAVALERFFRNRRWGLKAETLLAICLWGLLAYHCTLATASFYHFSFRPFPTPDTEISHLLRPDSSRDYPKLLPAETTTTGNLLTFNPDGNRSLDPKFVDSYMNQWPTLGEVFSIHGYDPLVYESPTIKRMGWRIMQSPQHALAEYGVRYFLQYTPPGVQDQVSLDWPGVQVAYSNDRVRLYELPFAYPMAFPEQQPQALPVSFDFAGTTINTSEMPQGGYVILNLLWRNEFRSKGDGQLLRTEPDDWGRIRVFVPPATSVVRVAFCTPWKAGWLTSLALLLCGVLLMTGSSRLRPGK
jgi:hypothetical protein